MSRSPGNTYRPGQPSAPRNTGPTQPLETPEGAGTPETETPGTSGWHHGYGSHEAFQEELKKRIREEEAREAAENTRQLPPQRRDIGRA